MRGDEPQAAPGTSARASRSGAGAVPAPRVPIPARAESSGHRTSSSRDSTRGPPSSECTDTRTAGLRACIRAPCRSCPSHRCALLLPRERRRARPRSARRSLWKGEGESIPLPDETHTLDAGRVCGGNRVAAQATDEGRNARAGAWRECDLAGETRTRAHQPATLRRAHNPYDPGSSPGRPIDGHPPVGSFLRFVQHPASLTGGRSLFCRQPKLAGSC